jgi:hypothetical protein
MVIGRKLRKDGVLRKRFDGDRRELDGGGREWC